MKKNCTCYVAALELTIASSYMKQFMRLLVHFYSKLTLNPNRVFVITSFCDLMWNLVVYCCKNMLFIAFYIAAQISISDVHFQYCYKNAPNLKKITYKPFTNVIVCLLFGYFVGTEVSLCCCGQILTGKCTGSASQDRTGQDMMHSYDGQDTDESGLCQWKCEHGRLNTQRQRWERIIIIR